MPAPSILANALADARQVLTSAEPTVRTKRSSTTDDDLAEKSATALEAFADRTAEALTDLPGTLEAARKQAEEARKRVSVRVRVGLPTGGEAPSEEEAAEANAAAAVAGGIGDASEYPDQATFTPTETSVIPPLPREVDRTGASWERPSWMPLALSVGGATAFATTLTGSYAVRGKKRAAAAAAIGVSAVTLANFGAATMVARQFLGAHHTMPLTDEEKAFVAEHPESADAELLRRKGRIGHLLIGGAHDPFETFSGPLLEKEVATLWRNRNAEARATWEWIGTQVVLDASTSAEDDVPLFAHILTPNPLSRDWAVLAHGWNGTWVETMHLARNWARLGYNLLVPDMRGHGRSGGEFVGMGWLDRRDLICWVRWLVERKGADIRVVLHGHSMGGASVCMAAGEGDLPSQVVGVVSDCAYSDVLNVFGPIMREGMSLPPHPTLEFARLALRVRPGGYDLVKACPEAALRHARVPVLILHGEHDVFVPPYMAKRLYDALPAGLGRLETFDGAGHVQAPFADPGRYWAAVAELAEGK